MTFGEKQSTSQIGALAELNVSMALTKKGLTVWVPFFNPHSRIDLLYESANGQIRRVQCKSAHYKNDVVMFYTCSHTGGVERRYDGEVDEFGVFCPMTGLVYLVPIEDVPARVGCLRVAATKNNQARRIRWAHDYVLGPP